jgi:hypothetical protein
MNRYDIILKKEPPPPRKFPETLRQCPCCKEIYGGSILVHFFQQKQYTLELYKNYLSGHTGQHGPTEANFQE